MRRLLPIVCVAALVVLLVWQLLALPGAEPQGELLRVPVFSPASLGMSPSGGARCPGAQPSDAAAQALAQVPLQQLLDTLARGPWAQQRPELRDALTAIAEQYRALLELRNQRHAWNVESMELVTALADVLEPDQLEWILSNRDQVTLESMDQGAWRQLGIEP